MTIGAISSTNIYSTAIQYQYFGTDISDDKIKDLMRAYGIMTTGDAKFDIQSLYDAMKAAANGNLNNAQQQSAPEVTGTIANVPWADLMNQVGLSPIGDLETDYNAFTQQINLMQISAASPQEKANVAQLQAQAGIVFIDQSSGSSQKSQISGANILAQLNKMYLMS